MKYIFTSLVLLSFVVHSQVIPVNFDHIPTGVGVKDGKVYSIGFDNKTWTQEYEYSDTFIIQFICLDASTYDTLWTKRYITEWLPELYDSYEIEFGNDSINFITNLNNFRYGMRFDDVYVISIDYNGNTDINQHEVVYEYDYDYVDTVHYSIVGKVLSGYEYKRENRMIGDFEYYVGSGFSIHDSLRNTLNNGQVFLYKVLDGHPLDSVLLGHHGCGFESEISCDIEYNYFSFWRARDQFYRVVDSEVLIGNQIITGDASDWSLLGKNSKNRIRTFDSNLNLASDTVFSLENDDSSFMSFNNVYEKNGGAYFDFIHWTLSSESGGTGSENTSLFYKDNKIISSLFQDKSMNQKFDDSGNIYFILNDTSLNWTITKTDSEFNLIEHFTYELDSFVEIDFFIQDDGVPLIIAYNFDSIKDSLFIDEWFRSDYVSKLPIGTSIIYPLSSAFVEEKQKKTIAQTEIVSLGNSLIFQGFKGLVKYSIYDLSGRKVSVGQFSENKIVDISNLNSSIFFVEVYEESKNGGGNRYVEKVFK